MATDISVAMFVEQCYQPQPGGSATYIVELARALAAEDDCALTGFAARHHDQPSADLVFAAPVTFLPLSRRALYESWQRLRRPVVDRWLPGAQVVHAPTWAIPATRLPLVVTVHDLAFLHYPQFFTPHGVRFFNRAWRALVAGESHVVVPSAATARDARDNGLAPARISVIPHGVRRIERTAQEVERFKVARGLTRPYILWCGVLEPRKNLSGLLRAFARMLPDAGVDLVLAGPPGWGEVPTELIEAIPADRLHMVGHLSTAELASAYAGAEAFCFPSIWEGFGMPVLEAMAQGVPVVTSAGTSMAEFVGGAGELVDPADPGSIAAGLTKVLGEGRERYAAAALKQAAAFTWRECARRHIEVYRAAASRGTSR